MPFVMSGVTFVILLHENLPASRGESKKCALFILSEKQNNKSLFKMISTHNKRNGILNRSFFIINFYVFLKLPLRPLNPKRNLQRIKQL